MPRDPFQRQLSSTLIAYLSDSSESDERQEYLRRRKHFWNLYRQKKWYFPDGHEYLGEGPISTENILFPTVETLVSVLFKNLPIVQLDPYKNSDYDLIFEQNKHLMYAMGEADLQEKMRDGSRECFIAGMCTYMTGWDASKIDIYDNGDCYFKPLPPQDMFLDPMPGIKNLQDSRFAIVRHWVPFEVLMERFGGKAGEAIGAEIKDGSGRSRFLLPTEEVTKMVRGGLQNPNTQGRDSDDSQALSDLFDPKGSLYPLYECWFKSRGIHESKDSDGIKKYKRNDVLPKVAYLLNGNVINGPKSNIFRKYKSLPQEIDGEQVADTGTRTIPVGHGQYPFVNQIAYQVIGDNYRPSLYSVMGVIEQLESLQFDINVLSQQEIINATTIANPMVIIDEKEVVSPKADRLKWIPGGKIVVRGTKPLDEAVHVQNPGTVAPFATQTRARKHNLVSQISGVKDFVSGDIRVGTSHTTAEGMGLVSEASFSQLHTLIFNTDKAMEGIVKQFAGLQQLFYKVGRSINLTIDGQSTHAEWSSRNIYAEFKYSIISGTSTPLQDIERQRNVTLANEIVKGAVQEPTANTVRLAVMTLEDMKLPWTHNQLSFLKRLLEDVEEQEALNKQAELLLAAQQFGGGGQGQQPDSAGMLANQLGVTPEQLIGALS